MDIPQGPPSPVTEGKPWRLPANLADLDSEPGKVPVHPELGRFIQIRRAAICQCMTVHYARGYLRYTCSGHKEGLKL